MDVRGCESQKSVSRVDQSVLAAVVFNHSLPMVPAVVLERKPRLRVIQINPTDEVGRIIVEPHLDLRSGQAGADQKPPKPRLHRRFGRRRQRGKLAHLRGTAPTFCRLGKPNQGRGVGKSSMDSHAQGDERLDWWQLQAQSHQRDRQRRRLKPADRNYFHIGSLGVVHSQTGTGTNPRHRRDDDLDWIGRLQIEPLQPGSARTAEGGLRRQNALPRRQRQPGIVPLVSPAIKA